MPKTITVSTGPFKDLGFPGHEDADDFDREAGYKGACAEEGDTSICYRSTLPEFHKAFYPTMESLSGIKRNENEEATTKAKARAKDASKVEPILESFITYANKVKASVSPEDWAVIDAEARKVASGIKIDSSPSKRMAGPGKDLLAKADSLLTLPEDQLQAKVAKYMEQAKGFELEADESGKPERVSLARLVGKYLEWQLAQI